MDHIETLYEQLSKLPKYSQFSKEVIEDVLQDAIYLYLRLRRNEEQTEFNASELNWIKRAAKEFLDKIEIPSGVIHYSESVYSLTFDSSSLSKGLLDEVTPLVKFYSLSSVERTESANTEDSKDDAG